MVFNNSFSKTVCYHTRANIDHAQHKSNWSSSLTLYKKTSCDLYYNYL